MVSVVLIVTDCYPGELRCDNGSNTNNPSYLFCYNSSSWCDGVLDCADGSDEPTSCRVCPDGYSACSTGYESKTLLLHYSQVQNFPHWIGDANNSELTLN